MVKIGRVYDEPDAVVLKQLIEEKVLKQRESL